MLTDILVVIKKNEIGVIFQIHKFAITMCNCAKVESHHKIITVPVVWVLGGPGCGKGTQCNMIKKKYGFVHMSSGDLLRAEAATGSERGKYIEVFVLKGELVPTPIVLKLLREAIDQFDDPKGFLIDGYPRQYEQGVLFERDVHKVNMVLYFEASDEVLTDRMLTRGQLTGRADDNIDAIKVRLQLFHEYEQAITDNYADRIKRVSAEQSPDDIFAEVVQHMDELMQTV
ncbi:PREDICTED: adenylate kinase isoenzyme 1-like [Nicrophorus vespilloides]|uniref:Adenylate kinase isoenzyme 1-like n=1 Tax=Nicrophorus vespilloides TaxID=110193 RepID=A0ABM1MML9_NICVS|nr:PREDICTED: adenylate kinase isoenzyme 1-like [Nicrophorus vespilloides]